MKKIDLSKWLKSLLSLTLITALLITSGCSDDDTAFVPTQTLYELMSADAELSVLKGYIDDNAELLAIVQGTAPYTVFAPTNAAFEKLRVTLNLESLDLIAADHIATVLSFHFVSGSALSSVLPGQTVITESNDEAMTFNADGTIFDGGTTTDVAITSADNLATNGVMHKVGTILIPPSFFAVIGATLGSLAQPILLGSDFTYLAYILTVADSDVPTGDTPVLTTLSDKTGSNYTFFATANAIIDGAVAANPAFTTVDDFYAAFGLSTAAGARKWMLDHLIIDATTVYSEANLTSGAYTMASGLGVTITDTGAPSADLPTGWVITSQNLINSPIYQFDVAVAGNSAMHVTAPIY